MKNCSFFILLIITLSSCQIQKNNVSIEYNHKNSNLSNLNEEIPNFSNNEEIISSRKIDETNSEFIEPKKQGYILSEANMDGEKYKILYHEVQVGETIEEIALKYEQTIEEIALINSLYPPFYLIVLHNKKRIK